MYLLHELWPKNDDTAKLKYIQKDTKSFAYDEDTKAWKKNKTNLLYLQLIFTVKIIFIISHTKIPIIVMFAVRL